MLAIVQVITKMKRHMKPVYFSLSKIPPPQIFASFSFLLFYSIFSQNLKLITFLLIYFVQRYQYIKILLYYLKKIYFCQAKISAIKKKSLQKRDFFTNRQKFVFFKQFFIFQLLLASMFNLPLLWTFDCKLCCKILLLPSFSNFLPPR